MTGNWLASIVLWAAFVGGLIFVNPERFLR